MSELTKEQKEKKLDELWKEYDIKWHDWVQTDQNSPDYEKKHSQLGEIRRSMRQYET